MVGNKQQQVIGPSFATETQILLNIQKIWTKYDLF